MRKRIIAIVVATLAIAALVIAALHLAGPAVQALQKMHGM